MVCYASYIAGTPWNERQLLSTANNQRKTEKPFRNWDRESTFCVRFNLCHQQFVHIVAFVCGITIVIVACSVFGCALACVMSWCEFGCEKETELRMALHHFSPLKLQLRAENPAECSWDLDFMFDSISNQQLMLPPIRHPTCIVCLFCLCSVHVYLLGCRARTPNWSFQ